MPRAAARDRRPLVVSSDERLVDDLLRLLAAAGADQHEGCAAVRPTQGGTAGGQLGLGAGGGQQAEQVVDEPLVGADDERAAVSGGTGQDSGHGIQSGGTGHHLPEHSRICG